MKVFAAGIATETNTFCAVPTGVEDFIVQRGRDAVAGRVDYPSLDLTQSWGQQAEAAGAAFIFGLNAWAQPSGVTTAHAYESLRDEVLRDLRAAMPVDVVLLNLHGAMVAVGYEDCERDLIGRVREIIGPDVVLGVLFDLHCHLTEAKIAGADVVLTYKEYPHTDINDRMREVLDLAVATRRGWIRPAMALFDCRMIGSYPTSRQPLRGFVDGMMQAEGRDGVLAVSFAHGFRLADLPHVGAKMLVVADGDAARAERVAQDFGERIYGLRRQIGFASASLPLEDALSRALGSVKTPVIVADQSDNPGSGAPGDATFALRWLVERRAEGVALAVFYDPEVVKIAKKAGRGATLPVRLGGKTGPTSGEPLDLEVTVRSVVENYVHHWPQSSGPPVSYPLGDVVALRCGGLEIVVGSQRCQCYSPAIFSDLGIDPHRARVLVVKSAQHFYGAFSPMAGEVLYMTGRGAAPLDPRQLTYRRLDTKHLYPWAEDPLGLDAKGASRA